MRFLEDPFQNHLYFYYRLISPLFDPVRFFTGIQGYFWFIKDLLHYKLKAPNEKLLGINLFPILNEKTHVHPFDAHYFYQELWAFRHILREKPKRHVDIASKYQFSGFIAAVTKSEYVDIRLTTTFLKNFTPVRGSILDLPYKNNSLLSVSSLHVIEHIGLGRYGDPIDPEGSRKAALELTRVLKPGGRLYLSLPLGRYRVCFNAHRIFPATTIASYFSSLELREFSVVDDQGKYYENVNYKDFENLHYGCGMYLFIKPS